MNLNISATISPEVVSREVSGETVIQDLKSELEAAGLISLVSGNGSG